MPGMESRLMPDVIQFFSTYFDLFIEIYHFSIWIHMRNCYANFCQMVIISSRDYKFPKTPFTSPKDLIVISFFTVFLNVFSQNYHNFYLNFFGEILADVRIIYSFQWNLGSRTYESIFICSKLLQLTIIWMKVENLKEKWQKHDWYWI